MGKTSLSFSIHNRIHNYNRKDLHGKLQQVFKFLQWKLMLSPECFTVSDQITVEENIVDHFADLSITCCSYTKTMVKEYTEKLWQNSVQNKWLLNGSSITDYTNSVLQ